MANCITTTIDLSTPIMCPHFRDGAMGPDCHQCRFFAICEAAREEFGP